MSKTKYRVLSGTILLKGGVKLSGDGETDDAGLLGQLRDLTGGPQPLVALVEPPPEKPEPKSAAKEEPKVEPKPAAKPAAKPAGK